MDGVDRWMDGVDRWTGSTDGWMDRNSFLPRSEPTNEGKEIYFILAGSDYDFE